MKTSQRIVYAVTTAALTGNTIAGLTNLVVLSYSAYRNTAYGKFARAHNRVLIGLIVLILLGTGFAVSYYLPSYAVVNKAPVNA